MDSLESVVLALTLSMVALFILTLVVATGTRRRMLKSGAMPPHVADQYRARLLESVKDASTEKGTRVILSGFWRDLRRQEEGLSPAQKYVVMRPLLQRGVLRPAESNDRFEQILQNVWRNVLNQPTGVVILNERDWIKMSHGAPGIQIGTMNGGVVSQGDGNHVTTNSYAPNAAFIKELVGALRVDSQRLPKDQAEQLESLADTLEIDSRRERWTQVQKAVETISGLVASGAKVMDSTAAVINTIS